jgi:outer membrane lipoprotein carrier protein
MKKLFTSHSMKIVLMLLAVLMFSVGLTAQDDKAAAILSKLSVKMQQYESVSATFESKMVDKQADMEVDQSGSIKVSGDNYKLEMGDITVTCDGQNVWTYMKKTNEVMVDLAEDLYDEEGIEPAELFTIWETGFKHEYAGTEEIGEVTCEVIKLFPNDPADKSFHTIKIYIDQRAMEMKRTVIQGKEGSDITYDIKDFDTGFLKSSEFTFDETKYPGVEVIDNR